MNTLLMRAGYPPVIIPKQQRSQYYHFLKLANEGDIRPFVRFIADCTEKTLDLYLWATSDLPQQIPMLIQTESDGNVLAKLQSHIVHNSPELYETGSGSGDKKNGQHGMPWPPVQKQTEWLLNTLSKLYVVFCMYLA